MVLNKSSTKVLGYATIAFPKYGSRSVALPVPHWQEAEMFLVQFLKLNITFALIFSIVRTKEEHRTPCNSWKARFPYQLWLKTYCNLLSLQNDDCCRLNGLLGLLKDFFQFLNVVKKCTRKRLEKRLALFGQSQR